MVGTTVLQRPKDTIMKMIMLTVCGLLFGAPALALDQYNTSTMRCSQVQATIQRAGQVQLRHPSPGDPSQSLYDTYVANSSYCNARATRTTTVPASDTARCKVRQCKRNAGR